MGTKYEVHGWTFGDRHGLGKRSEWYYQELYRGNGLLAALWCAFRARKAYGCVKLEMR